jgi:DNA-binding GntR family transcriptional regulator
LTAQKTVQKTSKPFKGIKAVGKPRPVGDMAYTSLKEAIVRGDLQPGQRLVESTLSAQMRISRIPIREAMKKLEQDDLVERSDTRGFIVKNPSREEIEETFGIRSVLESYAAALATERMNAVTIGKLEETLEAYRQALKKKDIATMMQLNGQMDEIIFTASGSKKLYSLIGNFRDFISRYRKALLTCLDYAAISLADHEKIVEAMKEGDAEKVEKLVRRHLIRGREIIIKDMDGTKDA